MVLYGHAAVYEIGMPDEYIAFFGEEYFRLEGLLFYLRFYSVFIIYIVLVAQEQRGLSFVEIAVQQVGQAVAARVIKERAIVGLGIFQGDPNCNQVAQGVGGHVDTVRMGPLIAALDEVNGLKRYYFLVQDKAQEVRESFVLCHIPDKGGMSVGEH